MHYTAASCIGGRLRALFNDFPTPMPERLAQLLRELERKSELSDREMQRAGSQRPVLQLHSGPSLRRMSCCDEPG